MEVVCLVDVVSSMVHKAGLKKDAFRYGIG